MAAVKIELMGVVRKAKEEGENYEHSIQLLVDWANQDEDLFRALMEGTLERRCRQLLADLASMDRRAVWNQGGGSISVTERQEEASNGQDISVLRAGIMLAFTLPHGQPLGKARAEDLEYAGTLYAKKSLAYKRNAIFVGLVKAQLKAGETVEDALTEEALRELLTQAEKESHS